MEIQNILMLIQAFTEHSLTELNVEDGGVKVCLKREAGAPGMTVCGSGAAVPGGMMAAETGGVLTDGNPAAGMIASGAADGAAPAVGVTVSGTTAGAAPVGAVPMAAAGIPAASGIPAAGTAAGVPVAGTIPVAGTTAAVPVTGVVPVAGTAVAAGVPMASTVPTAGGVPAAGVSAAGMVPAAVAGQEILDSDNVVVSPLVGIFYSASSPDAEDFVKVGDRVKKGQVLGIIEAMKLMNEIESEYDGVVEAILVKNEDVVEYGQPLFRIR